MPLIFTLFNLKVYKITVNNFTTFCQVILENENAKALINECDRYENTPLHVAAMNGYASVVQVRLSSVCSQTLTDIYMYLHFGLTSLSFLYYII